MSEIAESTLAEKTCGVVMPISSIDGCSEAHWSDVLDIHTEAIRAAGFEANLVSNADDIGIIQKRIVQNLYSNPIVVCDVSGKNPNVMLELGMRLAFDRAVVIVKDDKTSYSFDTSPIEHLTYPRDLRFAKIVEFKKELSAKIEKTVKVAASDRKYSPFLKHFGEFTVARIDTKVVSSDQYILEELRSLRRQITQVAASGRSRRLTRESPHRLQLCITRGSDTFNHNQLVNMLLDTEGIRSVDYDRRGRDHAHFDMGVDGPVNLTELRSRFLSLVNESDREAVQFSFNPAPGEDHD